MWNLKRNDTNALPKEKETHKLKNKFMVAGGGRRIGEEREFGIDMYTLLYLKWITRKGLLLHRDLCSILGGSLGGRGIWGRMETCICMAESLHCSPEAITTSLTLLCFKIE